MTRPENLARMFPRATGREPVGSKPILRTPRLARPAGCPMAHGWLSAGVPRTGPTFGQGLQTARAFPRDAESQERAELTRPSTGPRVFPRWSYQVPVRQVDGVPRGSRAGGGSPVPARGGPDHQNRLRPVRARSLTGPARLTGRAATPPDLERIARPWRKCSPESLSE